MPPLPNPPNPTLRCLLNWKIGADATSDTRLFFEYGGSAPSPGDCAAFCQDIMFAATGKFDPLMHPQVTLESVTVVDITTTSGHQGMGGTPLVGTRTGGQLAPATSALVRHAIGTRYRGGKPRSYMPFGTSTDIGTTGLWDSAFVTAVDSAWGSFIAAVIGNVEGGTTIGQYMVLSYYDGVNPPVMLPSGRVKQSSKLRTVPVQYDITGHTTSEVIASQRRRNRNA
jgi:hypothetical protein